jgi:hypothetical protein
MPNIIKNPEKLLQNNLSKISNQQIISALSQNKDCKDYMEKYKDFKLEKKLILTKENILEGQKAQNFKEVFMGLELENNRYIIVNLIDSSESNGFVAVVDFKENQVPKAYSLLLFKSNIQSK